MRSIVHLVTLVGMAVLLGACNAGASSGSNGPAASSGGNGPAASTGGGAQVTDPCALLTQAEVSQVVGQQVGPGTKDIEPKECDWQYPADGVPQVQASITIQTGNTLADLCEEPSSSALGITVTQVSGVGDGACFEAAEGLASGDNMTFAKGGQVFTISAILGADASVDQLEAADKALALAALGHL